ncbi:MAG TPA: PAS domain S-box protein [Ignavibacteriaceae bacterium]
MEIKNKEWLDILGRNSDYHGDALVILDDSFEIVFTNQKAATLFFIDDFNISLEQVFEKETVQELTDIIGPVINSFQKKSYKNFSVNFKTGNSAVFDLFVEPIQADSITNILIVFRNSENVNANEFLSRIKTDSLKNLLADKVNPVTILISELQKLAPFTIISLKRIQNLIDQNEYPIWVKDVESKLIAINNSYASILNVETSFAAGKKHETFLPPNQKIIYKMMDQYVILNLQQIILDGLSKKVKNIGVYKSVIQIPIVDNFNKILAIVGLIVDNKDDYYNFWGEKEFFGSLVNASSKPSAFLSSDGVIEGSNNRFKEFFNVENEQIVGKRIEEILSANVVNKINSFIQNDLTEESISLIEETDVSESSVNNDQLLLLKISNLKKYKSNIFISVETPDEIEKSENELQNILMHRGTMFETLIQKNPEPIFVYEKENLKFLEVNDAAIKLYGYNRDEFLQMDLTDLYAPEDIQTLLDSFGDESSEARFSKPFRHRKKDGSNILVEISKTSFRYNDKEAHFNIIKDITDSVEKDKQYQMLRAIFNESDLLVFNTDASGFIKFINNNVIKNLGYKSEEILQLSFASLVSDDDRGIVNTSIFQSHIKDSVILESKIKDSLGNYFDAEIYASPILDFDGGIDSFTIIVKRSSEKLVAEKPKEIIKEVVKEVFVERPGSTSSQKTIIPDSNFLSGMFHEILTPINVIIGFSQELISSTENPTEEQLEASEIINQNRIKMMDTMNAVVEYSDIMQNKSPLKIEDITITDVIEKLDDNIKDITGINDIQFAYGKISSSLRFKSDKQKFENFILSLIKVVSRLSKDKKVYFSAFSVDAETFLIGISDQYGNPSEYVSNVLEQVFVNDKDPKDFGLPKLTTYLARILLKLLDGKFYKSSKDTYRKETGFIFPIVLIAGPENKVYESVQEVISSTYSSEDFNEQTDNIQAQNDIAREEESEENLDQLVDQNKDENYTKDDTAELLSDESDDIFKPVQPIAQELLSKIDDEKYIENDSLQQEIESFSISDQNQTEELIDNEYNKKGSDIQENLSDEIKAELESDTDNFQQVKQPQSLDLTKLKCLYIEDQVDSQILFKVQMKELHDVKFAVSFEEAQVVLLNHHFDFIVMDINLQGEYNGLDALKIIKTMPAFSSIPIIAVTAYVLPGDKEKFIAAGFDDFISKPIFKEKMIESLEKIFLSKD